jgi:hypothetical protein
VFERRSSRAVDAAAVELAEHHIAGAAGHADAVTYTADIDVNGGGVQS